MMEEQTPQKEKQYSKTNAFDTTLCRTIICALILSVGFVLGLTYAEEFIEKEQPTKSGYTEKRYKASYTYINPLLECTDSFGKYTTLKPMQKTLEKYIETQKVAGKITSASIYFRDLNNGPWMGINITEAFAPASLLKLPLMISYYKLSETQPTIMDQMITYTAAHKKAEINQVFAPKTTYEIGKTYKVSSLLDTMITESNNSAYLMLYDNIKEIYLETLYSDIGITLNKTTASDNIDIINSKDYGGFFRILYNASYLTKDNSEKVLEATSRSTFTFGLAAGIPQEIKIAHKFGERINTTTGDKQLHECGIIYKANFPYVLCVMTKGNSFDNMGDVIRTISREIYNTDLQMSSN